MIDNNKNLLIDVSNIALNAGREIMNYYNSNSNVLTKEDKSPLTEADLASNNIIIENQNILEKIKENSERVIFVQDTLIILN